MKKQKKTLLILAASLTMAASFSMPAAADTWEDFEFYWDDSWDDSDDSWYDFSDEDSWNDFWDDFWGDFSYDYSDDYTYEYDPYWYDKDDSLSEGEKAAYHFMEHYYTVSEETQANNAAVIAQYDRIAANPCHETAAAEMAWVEIPVWRLQNGQKVPDTARVQVLSSVSEEVKAIFTEIYNGPEQFPIESVSAYTWRDNGLGSYHSAGLAIDINPSQNPQVRADGTVLVGNKWEPGVNPYSISRDSDVLKAFGGHGWYWGARFNTKDYMHFEW